MACEEVHVANLVANLRVENNQFWSSTIDLIRSGLLPPFNEADERPYTPDDFIEHSAKSLDILIKAITICQNMDQELVLQNSSLIRNFIAPVILLCAENSEKTDWTTMGHISASYKLQSCLKSRLFQTDSMGKLLVMSSMGGSDLVLRACLDELRPRMVDKNWKKYPGAQHSFIWLLNQITFPHLSSFVTEFLPYALQFTDDWQPRNKMIGVTCLRHIVREISRTEINWFGRADLIKNTLFHMLFTKEMDLLRVLLPTLTEFLQKVEGSKETAEQCARFDSWDQLTKRLLSALEMETKIELKRCYANHLLQILPHLGIGIVRWITSVLRVVGDTLDHRDPDDDDLRRISISIMIHLVTVGKVRVVHHVRNILEKLLRILYELSGAMSSTLLLELCKECLLATVTAAPKEFHLLCHGLDKVQVNPVFDQIMAKAFEAAINQERC